MLRFTTQVLMLGGALWLLAACGDDSTGGTDAGMTTSDVDAAANSGSGAGQGQAGEGAVDAGGDTDVDAGIQTPGPGIADDEGEVFCLAEQKDLTAAFYFGIQKQCLIHDKADGTFSASEQSAFEGECTSTFKGTVVDACPAEDRVAYCAVDMLTAAGTLHQQKIIYLTAVNPSGDAVARNSLQVCGASAGFDLNDKPLETSCTGKLSAKVDGTLVDFSNAILCTFKTDGHRNAFLVRGTDKLNDANSKELTLYVVKTGDKVELTSEIGQSGYGYLEGGTAAGAFAFSVTGEKATFTAKGFDTSGAGLSGTFELGKLTTSGSGSGGSVREITEGSIDITLDVL